MDIYKFLTLMENNPVSEMSHAQAVVPYGLLLEVLQDAAQRIETLESELDVLREKLEGEI